MSITLCPECGRNIASHNCPTCIELSTSISIKKTMKKVGAPKHTCGCCGPDDSCPACSASKNKAGTGTDHRSHNLGESNYAKHKIQPWDIWKEYRLNPWDADIVKRVLRTKTTDPRRLDYEKIIHICQERIAQIDEGYEFKKDQQ